MSDVLVEGFGSDISRTCSLILCDNASDLWIPYEFIGGDLVTRILLVGEHSSGTRGLIASESWTMILSMTGTAGSRNWSFLATMRKHLLEPILIVVGPDVLMPAAIMPILEGTTLIVYRWISEVNTLSLNASSIFFPISVQASQIVMAQRALWRGMALRTSDTNLPLILNETRPQGLQLVSSVLDGGIVSVAWYRSKDSNDMIQVHRQDSLSMWLGSISDRIVKLLKRTE